MLGLYEYNQLTIDEQADLLWQQGIFLTHYEKSPMDYVLFALGDFFVEVRYNQDENRIVALRTFRSTTPLQPYLDQIQIY